MSTSPEIPTQRPYVRADEGKEILVVEDHPVTMEFVRFALREARYKVRSAASAAEALRAMDQRLPDLLVLDLLLPDAHGLDICTHLRALPAAEDIPILIITGDERPQSHAEAVRAGADDFLRKPILAAELQSRVRSLLRLRRLRQHLRREKDDLLDLQMRQEEMVQFVMHDMKNMLGALLATADLSEESGNEADWQVHRRRMVACTRSLQGMVSNFLDLSLADQTITPLHLEEVPALAWLVQSVSEFDNFGTRRRHRFEVAVAGVSQVWVDPYLLRRALFNLLDNATRFAPEGSIIVVRADVDATGNRCHLSVSDQGLGVPNDLKQRIFDRLFLVESADKAARGKGLGLAFCKLVAERHHGEIRVEDNAPAGSRFILDIPLDARL